MNNSPTKSSQFIPGNDLTTKLQLISSQLKANNSAKISPQIISNSSNTITLNTVANDFPTNTSTLVVNDSPSRSVINVSSSIAKNLRNSSGTILINNPNFKKQVNVNPTSHSVLNKTFSITPQPNATKATFTNTTTPLVNNLSTKMPQLIVNKPNSTTFVVNHSAKKSSQHILSKTSKPNQFKLTAKQPEPILLHTADVASKTYSRNQINEPEKVSTFILPATRESFLPPAQMSLSSTYSSLNLPLRSTTRLSSSDSSFPAKRVIRTFDLTSSLKTGHIRNIYLKRKTYIEDDGQVSSKKTDKGYTVSQTTTDATQSQTTTSPPSAVTSHSLPTLSIPISNSGTISNLGKIINPVRNSIHWDSLPKVYLCSTNNEVTPTTMILSKENDTPTQLPSCNTKQSAVSQSRNFNNSDTIKSSVLKLNNLNNSDNTNSVSSDTFSIANKDAVPSENIPKFTLAFLDDQKKTNIGKVGDKYVIYQYIDENNIVKFNNKHMNSSLETYLNKDDQAVQPNCLFSTLQKGKVCENPQRKEDCSLPIEDNVLEKLFSLLERGQLLESTQPASISEDDMINKPTEYSEVMPYSFSHDMDHDFTSNMLCENLSLNDKRFPDFLNGVPPQQLPPLHLSVKEGNEVKVKRQCLVLSALKNNIDTKNFFEETALHIAVKEDFSKIAELLLKFSSNPNIQDADGNNALHLAILNDSFDCLKEIISGTRTNWLENAVNQFNFEGFAPIHLAVKIGHIETITALLGAGADINLKDVKSGRNPLFHAVEMDDTEMVSTLVKAGADSLEPNFAGQSAFQAAKEVPSKNKQMISHMITIEGIKQAESRNKVIKKQGRGTESGLHKPRMKKMKKEKKKRVSKKMSQKLIKSVATKTGLSVQAELNTVLEFEDE
ncbi:unnamed protein product [Timema podura]|uniref:Uncharacterized protein n=1 Tax=Timema podura TaxID=61482 RepID=A0ABN7NP34_TIMPD|nr:unnamed protein product [Timema podura]